MARITTYQPIKAIWVLLAVAVHAIRLPIWLFWYIPPFMRPHPAWSFKQAIRVQVVKAFLWNAAMCEMKTPLSLASNAEKTQWQVVQPAEKKAYTGVASKDPIVVPEALGGTWYPAKPSVTGKPGIVVMHFHGGAYVIGDGRKQDAGFAAKIMIANTEATHVFAPQYRLASNAGCRFPAALQDAITAYSYLVNSEGISPGKIVLSGDSAGANLVLSLNKYIAEYGAATGLTGPLCAWLWSPWVSPNRSLTHDAFNSSPNVGTDYITAAFGCWGAKAYQPNPVSGITLDSPYISFQNNPYKTSTPIYISTGECEVLFHDDLELAEQMKAVEGNQVVFQIEEHCVHDTILTGALMGFEKEAIQSTKRVNDFLKNVISGAKL